MASATQLIRSWKSLIIGLNIEEPVEEQKDYEQEGDFVDYYLPMRDDESLEGDLEDDMSPSKKQRLDASNEADVVVMLSEFTLDKDLAKGLNHEYFVNDDGIVVYKRASTVSKEDRRKPNSRYKIYVD